MADINPDDFSQLVQNFGDLNNSIQNMVGQSASQGAIQTELLKKLLQAQGVGVKDINDVLDKTGKGLNNLGGAANSVNTGLKKYNESIEYLKRAQDDAKESVKQLGKAALDTSRSFEKYGAGLSDFGDAALNAGKALGGFNVILGYAVKGLTAFAKKSFEQADAVGKAYDDLAKVGGAGGISTKQILDMGHEAGLTAKDLGKLTSVIKANGTSIAGLGATAADGMKVFGQLTAVGTDTIATYSKLGISQEDLIKNTGDYVALQMSSGRSLKNELQDRQKLQKASLAYQDNLLTLAQITGEDIESVKAKQKEATNALNWQIAQIQTQNKIEKLREQGNDAAIGKVIGPSFYADEIPDVMTNIINTYVEQRKEDEPFIKTYQRLGVAPFKEATYKNAKKKEKAESAGKTS